MKKWTVCENHAGWYVEGVAPNGGAIAVSAFGIPENEARLIVLNHDLQEQVKLLREALESVRSGSKPTGRWLDEHDAAIEEEDNDGADEDKVPKNPNAYWEEYTDEEQRLWLDSVVAIADRALEATKEAP